jgi:hypothetical protein
MERCYGYSRILATGLPAFACTVTVYVAGTAIPAAIFEDDLGTPLANPFTADAFGFWFFYAGSGRYDIVFSGGGIPTPYTLGDVQLFDYLTGVIGSLNGLTAAAQLFATGTAGTDFGIVSAVATHTFNIPSASATARGLVSTGAQTFAGIKTFAVPIAAGSGGTGLNSAAAAAGALLIGNTAGFTLSGLTAGANAGVTIANAAGSITLSTVQDIRTTASPTFDQLNLNSGGIVINLQGHDAGPDGAVLAVNATGGVLPVQLSDGQLLVGVSLGTPVGATVTGGDGILITAGAGSLQITNIGVTKVNSLTGELTISLTSLGDDVAIISTGTSILLVVPSASSTSRGVVTTSAQTFAGAKSFLLVPTFIYGSAVSSTTPIRTAGLLGVDSAQSSSAAPAADEILQLVVLPANSLDTNSSSTIRLLAWGTVAANANSKAVKLTVAGVVVAQLGASVALNGVSWWAEAMITRRSSSTATALGRASASTTSTATLVLMDTRVTALTTDWTIANNLEVRVTGVGAADVVVEDLLVEILS